MKLSLKRLARYLPFDWNKGVLTTAGLEIDEVIKNKAKFSQVVVGQVVDISPHPNADRLQCCVVDSGDQKLEIVCGASNVKVGCYYPVAKVGAVLPGDFKIKKSKIRGEASFGMLCSAAELGIDLGLGGIWDITKISTTLGKPFELVVDLSDEIYVFDLTPNRGDCLSYLGMVREIGALYDKPYHFDAFDHAVDIDSLPETDISLAIQVPEVCPHYVGVLIEQVNNTIDTPFEIAHILHQSGFRVTNNPVADITNYVMLLCGQPLHAFDQAHMGDQLCIRYAKKGEKLELLNNQSIDLQTHSLLIVGDDQPIALAGVMGGHSTAVNKSTRSIWLESAFFSPQVIAVQARRYGVKSDAAHRFERGVDFMLQKKAAALTIKLITTFCGGKACAKRIVCDSSVLPKRVAVELSIDRMNRLLGTQLDAEKVTSILKRFGMEVADNAYQNLLVKPPSFRFDINSLGDLAEEVARVIGYDQIQTQSMILHSDYRLNHDFSRPLADVLGEVLVHAGYQQCINYSFISPKIHQLFFEGIKPIRLLNPISMEQSVMRTSLLPSLLANVGYNLNRQQHDCRFYEMGCCFSQKNGQQGIEESQKMAGVLLAEISPAKAHWLKQSIVDFFTLKGYLCALFNQVSQPIVFEPVAHNWLVAGQSAQLILNDQPLGFCGLLKQKYLKGCDLHKQVRACFVFEFDFKLLKAYQPFFKPLSKFPTNRRDISLLVDRLVCFADMVQAIESELIDVLKAVHLIDCYEDDALGDNLFGMTLSIILEADRTLKTSEIDEVVQKVVLILEDKFKVKQRV